MPAWTPVTITLEADDRTACVFMLEESINAPETQVDGAEPIGDV